MKPKKVLGTAPSEILLDWIIRDTLDNLRGALQSIIGFQDPTAIYLDVAVLVEGPQRTYVLGYEGTVFDTLPPSKPRDLSTLYGSHLGTKPGDEDYQVKVLVGGNAHECALDTAEGVIFDVLYGHLNHLTKRKIP